MRYRNPARFLAPLALLACAFAVYSLVQPATDSGSASPSTSSPATSTATTAARPSVRSIRRAKSYKVRPNDTLSGIAVKAGLSVEHITKLNPGLDVNTLRVGRTLKLRQ